MKQPAWKRLLSYATPLTLETSQSDYNPLLRVALKRGQYQLLSANAIYSYGAMYDNFVKAFQRIDIKNRTVEDVLILGFGLGSIPYMLEKVFDRKYYYTAVEIDAEVLHLANKYVVPDLDSSINFIVSDAQSFVAVCEEQFQLICMDVFLDDKVPEELQEEDFLEDVKRLLAPGGILLYNKLAYREPDKKEALHFLETRFSTVFPKAGFMDVDGNFILVNDQAFIIKKGG